MDQDQEDELFRLHDEYIRQISESGIPLWVLDQYSQEGYYQSPNNQDPDNSLPF